MTQSNATQKLEASFTNTAVAAPVMPCCKNVKGEWLEGPTIDKSDTASSIRVIGPGGVYPTYYLDVIPKGFKVTARLRVAVHITGTLVCKCLDDGRELSKSQFNQPVPIEFEMPVWSTNVLAKVVSGPAGWAMFAADVAYNMKKLGDMYQQNEAFINEVIENAGPAAKKAMEAIEKAPDAICKNRHKCPENKPPGGKEDGPSQNIEGEPGTGPALIS